MELLHLSRWVEQAVQTKRLSFSVVDALKVMLCAHLFKSNSRAELAVWDWQQKLFWHPHRVEDLEYQHLLRSLSVLTSIKDEIESKLFLHLGDLFDYNADLVFYDLTSSYVEGVADWSELLKRGYPARIRFARILSFRVVSFLINVMASRRNQLTFSPPWSL